MRENSISKVELVSNRCHYWRNCQIQSICGEISRIREVKNRDVKEVKAVSGILYMTRILKSTHTNLNDLWASDATAP